MFLKLYMKLIINSSYYDLDTYIDYLECHLCINCRESKNYETKLITKHVLIAENPKIMKQN